MKKNPPKSTNENDAEIKKVKAYNDYIEFYALPANERADVFGCKTQQQFAAKYDVHRSTLTGWGKRREFITKIKEKRDDWGKAETGNVFAGWRNSCIKGNPHAIELWLAYFLDWNKEQVIKHVQEFTKEDLVHLVKVLPDGDQQKFYDTINTIISKARKISEQRKSGNGSVGEQDERRDGDNKPSQADNLHEGQSAGNEVAESPKESVRNDMERGKDENHNESAEGGRKE